MEGESHHVLLLEDPLYRFSAYLLLFILQAVPQQSHFSDEQTGPIRVSRLSQDHICGNLLSWHRLIPEPSSKSLAFYTTPKHANTCLHLHLPFLILALLEFFFLTGQFIRMIL